MCEADAGMLCTVPCDPGLWTNNGTLLFVVWGTTVPKVRYGRCCTRYGKLLALNFSLILAPGILRTLQLNRKAPRPSVQTLRSHSTSNAPIHVATSPHRRSRNDHTRQIGHLWSCPPYQPASQPLPIPLSDISLTGIRKAAKPQ